VVLVVSNGPALKMPQLVNANCKAAVDALRGMQLVPNVNLPEPLWPAFTVKAQSVKDGDPVQAGQRIDLACG